MNLEKTINRIMGVVLSAFAFAALIAALFFDAPHQFFTAILCSGLSAIIFNIKTD